ncbi:hypothetical protein [Tenacibaculum aiptasiae]|uniref:hypothetical protein n=1 Tax=Tenacibaculum aiptasiae TaxID=426481 RepID=UPI00232FAEA3|nr:hypothetical protein [Tenacibaculum aiptasiae]
MSFFSNNNFNEESRRNLAFQVLVVHRDLLQLASKKKQPPTYENALGLLNELAPKLYNDFIQLLNRKNQSELVQYFTDLADIKSQEQNKEISPIDLIDKQIKTLQNLHDQDPSKKTVSKRLLEHIVAKEKMEPIRLTENRILNRDFNQLDRSSYSDRLFQNDFYSDYKLRNSNILRIRFLHPDSDEHITGADLIYEQYDLKKDKVRFVFLQYKMWENNIIYKSSATNLTPQLEKMTKLLCNKKLCHSSTGKKKPNKYRLPYCAGFLRPTDKIQESNSKLISSGYHIPICNALKLIKEEGKIEKKMIREESFRSHIFEELFNSNMVGTRWVNREQLEKLYEENNVFKKSNRIKLYAQEMIKNNN